MRLSSICISLRSFRSSAPSGSSRSSTRGFMTSARARATRCCWPPESIEGRWASRPTRRTSSSASPACLWRSFFPTLRCFSPYATLSRIDMCGKSAYCWKTVFTSRLYGGTPLTSRPPIRSSPSSGCSKPAIIRSEVVLPQPDGPSSERNSPLCTRRLTAFTAVSEPKRFVIARNSTSTSPSVENAVLAWSAVTCVIPRSRVYRWISPCQLRSSHLNRGSGSVSRMNAPAIKLDPVNRRIIEILQREGRSPFTSIARELGISEAAVRARVQRLTDAGVLDVVAVTNPLKLGFDVMALVGVQANSDLGHVADTVSEWAETSYVVITSGSYDLLVGDAIADERPPGSPRSGPLGIAVAVLGGLVAAGTAAVGISSQGGQLLAFLAAILALVALALGFIGFTVARLGGTTRIPGIAAMLLGLAVIAGLIAAAVS